MAEALDVDFDGDPPIFTRSVEQDLEYFSTIDEATKSWLNSLHHIWGLCKLPNLIFKLTFSFEFFYINNRKIFLYL